MTDVRAVKVGGRTFTPSFPIVDNSQPTDLELKFTATLDKFPLPLEGTEGIERRERVLIELKAISRAWIQHVCREAGMNQETAESAGGELYTSGSYRLGVHEAGADIDCILVAPAACTKHHFFGSNMHTSDEDDIATKDPNSLAERILFARLQYKIITKDFDIDNDAVLDGADSATEKSLNGPRVTNLIAAFMKNNYPAFLHTVRCVRVWLKARGLYSNKMGYWGGVNCNIAVAMIVQLYPNDCAASLLRKFFLVMDTWKWPQPILLTQPHDSGYGLAVWAPGQKHQVAPMITPAYPAMNSTLSCSRQTLAVMTQEFSRGRRIVEELWQSFKGDPSQTEMDWAKLFAPADFFTAYPRYLSLCITGPTPHDAQTWAGFVESRLRKLVSDGLARRGANRIQLWPKKIEACVADPTALLTKAQRQNSVTYFVGFSLDRNRVYDEWNVEVPLYHFKTDLSRFQVLVPGMDLVVSTFRVKELPLVCFGSSREEKRKAMKLRRKRRNDDPFRQERRHQRNLAELKEKMEAIQQRKRKRESAVEGEKEQPDMVTESSDVNMKVEEATPEEEQEEADQLENALDAIYDGKTREEAQADREKLLSGELPAPSEDPKQEEDDGEESDTEYLGDGAHVAPKEFMHDKYSLPPTPEQAAILKQLGCPIVSDEEYTVLGADVTLPWQKRPSRSGRTTGSIKFLTKFDVVELDSFGRVVDKGDEDFQPAKGWTGRRAGFEFKMGARGLGYYRTGKKVVVPSNVAY